MLSAEPRNRPLSYGILELIWRQRQISRAEIARQTGLSRSTVSEVVSELLASGLIMEAGDGPSRGGRRPILLKFCDAAHVILGVDMGSTHVSVVLTDLRGRELEWEHRDHPVRTDPKGTERLISELCDAALGRREGARKRLLGVGVAVPSPVDPLRPKQMSDVLLPHWSGHGVLEHLQFTHQVPVVVDNDANLGALAEHWWGGGRGLEDFTYIKLGTGVGSGHLLSGDIYRGSSGVAGEIGHMVVQPDGLTCSCGNRGCLETLVGTPALIARAQALAAEHPTSALASAPITMEAIEDAALAGDAAAVKLVHEAAESLAIAVADVLNLLNPAAVVIGGSLARVGPLFMNHVKDMARSRTLVNSAASARILASTLGPHAIARGAATLVLHQALTLPTMFPTLVTS